MKSLALLPLLATLVLAVAACEEADKEALNKACPQAEPAMKNKPALRAGFPDAQGVVYTGYKTEGPTTVVSGYIPDMITPAHQTYSNALKGASGFTITKEEQDVGDSEVNFKGNGTSGQVKLLQICKARTKVTITIRPA